MCGPSDSEIAAQRSEASFMDTLQGNYRQNAALQGAALEHINSVLEPILAAGPGQQGFTPEENAALNTEAIDTTGAAAKNAIVADQTAAAAHGGGGNLPESGIDQAIAARTRSAAAGQLANEELGITEADYNAGREQFNRAVSGEEALASEYNPTPIAGAANNANQEAFSEADTINQQSNQVASDIFGGVESLAGVGLGFAGGFAGGGGWAGGLKGAAGAL